MLTCWLIKMMAISRRRVNSIKLSSIFVTGVSVWVPRNRDGQMATHIEGQTLGGSKIGLSIPALRTGIDDEKVWFRPVVDVSDAGEQEARDGVLLTFLVEWRERGGEQEGKEALISFRSTHRRRRAGSGQSRPLD